MTKQKNDFLNAFNQVKSIKEMDKKPQEMLQEAKPKKKMGRPSHKVKGKEYVKVSTHLEKEYKEQLQLMLLQEYNSKFVSLEEFVQYILVNFIAKQKNKK